VDVSNVIATGGHRQIVPICAPQRIRAEVVLTAQNGGYRTSRATQRKLRCVTERMVAPRRRSPNRRSVGAT